MNQEVPNLEQFGIPISDVVEMMILNSKENQNENQNKSS